MASPRDTNRWNEKKSRILSVKEQRLYANDEVNDSFLDLSKVLCPVSIPFGTGYIRHAYQFNEDMMLYVM